MKKNDYQPGSGASYYGGNNMTNTGSSPVQSGNTEKSPFVDHTYPYNDFASEITNAYPSANLKMIVLKDSIIKEYDLYGFGKNRLTFGRDSSSCDIVIDSDTVSRKHGRIKLENGCFYIGDLGSTNGIMIADNNVFRKLRPQTYYAKSSGDMILRIMGNRMRGEGDIVIIITASTSEKTWQKMPVGNEAVTIGRDDSNTISIHSPMFSRRHAAIIKKGDSYFVTDNNSMNGVYVNGKRINAGAAVHDRDLIQIAGSIFILADDCLIYRGESTGVSLRIRNINKIVGSGRGKKKILNRVYADIESNEFVAIIGGSGAGKTTLMNAMSGFDENISGRILMNGIDLRSNFSSLKNMIGFVPQQDIIYENLKLHKMLSYTAKMKMPSDTSAAEREKRIRDVLKMVDLTQHADTYIRKLSGGQKKRASIAVELLADPGLFFLDEPTSGLDPDTERNLMHTLARLSKSEGKTIIMVTHTTQSIDLCDKVIFMGPGGKICYCGAPSDIPAYFHKNSLVDVYSELAVNADTWNTFYLKRYREAHAEQKDVNDGLAERTMRSIKRRASRQVSSLRQLFVMTSRYFELIKNDRQRLLLLMLQPFLIGLLLTIVADKKVFKTYSSTQPIMFALACSGIWIGLFNTIQEICKERQIIKREYMGNMKLWAYILSKFIVQFVVCMLQTVIITTVFILSVKHDPPKAQILPTPQMEIGLTMFLTIYASAAMGLIVSACVKNSDRAMAIAPFVLIIQLLFSGVLFKLKGASKAISNFTVSRWAMECLGNIANLNNLDSGNFDLQGNKIPTVKNDFYNRGVGHLEKTWLILILISVICGIIGTYVLRNLKKDQR